MIKASNITATILGCGSSGGVPRLDGNWGSCDPTNPKNRRRRCSLLLTGTNPDMPGETNILIDTGCDTREQMLSANVRELDAVFYTHEHADHTHGIDDLRVFALSLKRRIDVYFNARTMERLHQAFGYCFTAPKGSPYPPILNSHQIEAGSAQTIEGKGGSIEILPFDQVHGNILSLGFRIANLAYSCDLSDLPDQSRPYLSDLGCWIVDALRPVHHPSHFSLPDALQWIEQIKSNQAVLTNMHIDMDYDWVQANTPANVQPAFDGLKIDCISGRPLARK